MDPRPRTHHQHRQYIREAYHAGSWYDDRPSQLEETLTYFLSVAATEQQQKETTVLSAAAPEAPTKAPREGGGLPRGVIAPHAGYRYSGPTAAYAYISLIEALEASWSGTVVVLHPSHHEYLNGCAVSGAVVIKTPLGDLPVDETLRSELLATGEFSIMTKETDEREHSGEMQFPFIQKAFLDASSRKKKVEEQEKQGEGSTSTSSSSSSTISSRNRSASSSSSIRVLPIMVGAVSTRQEKHFGKVLAPYLSRANVFTVVSSDFCHWGVRFGYTPTSPPDHIKANVNIQDIYQYIEWMDRLGMDTIASQEPGAFAKYIGLYKNTICGRHPIAVYLSALQVSKESGWEEVQISFVKYAQSSQVKYEHESSVSYASAVTRKV